MRREYKTGTKWCFMRWKDLYWNKKLYLSRLHIFQCPLFAIMLHFFNTEDTQRHLHDHPVNMLSIILSGSYDEVISYGGYKHPAVQINSTIHRKWFNWIPYHKMHRIAKVYGNVITLCLVSSRKQEWGFFTEHGKIGWQEYYKHYEGAVNSYGELI